MIIKYDLSTEGIKNFEHEHLLYTIDEMLAMDNKRRWAELTIITHFENWMEDDKKVNTAQTLMFLIELDKGCLDCPFSHNKIFIEQYFIVKWAREGMATTRIAKRTRRDPNTLRRILKAYGVKQRATTAPKTVIVVTHDCQRIEFPNAQQAAESEWCDITANSLRARLAKAGNYTNNKAFFYYEEDEDKWNGLYY
ncbi:helix-turn-helix domain-containing protein [Enterococcus faecium]|nr:helix-turn-helix domain-containing protein [Enterococcus faecium]